MNFFSKHPQAGRSRHWHICIGCHGAVHVIEYSDVGKGYWYNDFLKSQIVPRLIIIILMFNLSNTF